MAAEARTTGDPGRPLRIGRYEALLQIGSGGMARVYLAVLPGVRGAQKPELVVVKLLRPEVVEDEHVLALFADEARIATRLEHPNVIRTREVIAEPPDYALAMDFHDGRSLLDVVNRLGRQAVPLDEHIYVLVKVLAGLSYAHELEDEDGRPFGIVHRDVSPANVLVSYSGEVKLLDFGIAKATGALAATRDGVVRGKLGYAAPEQCLGQPADPRSDVYAVGVMLWEAIAGRRRASGETWQSVLQARLDDAEPALEEVCPDVPPALAAIVRKALARDPDARYATARQFQADLEGYLRDRRGPALGPARIAAMLKPHFDQDRAELQRSVRTFLSALPGTSDGQVSRLPLPGKRAASPTRPSLDATRPETAAGQEENTAPIPVDTALLMLSRGETATAPASSTPTAPPASSIPTVPPASSTPTMPPASPTPTVPPASSTPTVPPPPGTSPPRATLPGMSPESFAADASPSSEAQAAPVAEPTLPAPLAAPVAEPASPAPSAVAAPTFPAPLAAPVAAPTFPAPLAAPVAASTFPAPLAVAAPTFPAPSAIAAAPRKKTPVWPFLLLAIGAVGAGALVALPRLAASKASAVRPPEPTTVTEPAPSPSTSPSAPSAPKIDTVKVRISVDPADAVVTLDGRVLTGNPYVATLPRDNAEHELVAVAQACKELHQSVHLNSDIALLVAMKCQRQGLHLTARPPTRRSAGTASPATPRDNAEQAPPSSASEDNPYK